MMMSRALLYSFALQVSGVLGFIAVGSHLPLAWLKTVVVMMFVAGTVLVVFKFFPAYKMPQSLSFSLWSAMSFVVTYQTIGFNFYPGLVKDVVPLSSQHLLLSSIVFAIMFVFYNLCCGCLLVKRRGAVSP